MDAAVQLIQELKKLQAMETEYSFQSFNVLYGHVLDYVGSVVDQIKQVSAYM